MNFFNSAQIHLALNHFPMILSLTGFIILLVARIYSNTTLTKTGFYILLTAAVVCLPAYFSGEGTERIVKNLAGVSKDLIEEHEEMGEKAFILCIVTGMLSLIGILFYSKYARLIHNIIVLVSVLSISVLAWTSHLGGQIRHQELRKDFIPSPEKNRGDIGIEEHEHHD